MSTIQDNFKIEFHTIETCLIFAESLNTKVSYNILRYNMINKVIQSLEFCYETFTYHIK